MKRTKTRKHIVRLPNDFGEMVLLKEIKFSNGDRSIELIRELLYLYSIGMEYYDSINNSLLYSYYSQRNIAMLTNSEVTSVLDKNPKNNSGTDINLFKGDMPYKLINLHQNDKDIKRLTKNNNESNLSLFLPKNSPHKQSVRQVRSSSVHTREVVKTQIDSEMHKLKSHVEHLDHLMENEKNTQLNSFHLKRQQKIDSMKIKDNKNKKFVVRRGSKLDDLLIAAVSHGKYEGMEKSEILQSICELSEKKLESNQAIMMKEIEDYIDKNMNEMHKALEELKFSFEEEIKGLEQDTFPDVINALKEDMEAEVNHLREQYEEFRRDGVEKIKSKYKKK